MNDCNCNFLAAANERIQTLTVENECLSASCKACADQYADERAISDKLEKAYLSARDMILEGRGPLEAVLDGDSTNAVLDVLDDEFFATLAEIAAMRKGEKN